MIDSRKRLVVFIDDEQELRELFQSHFGPFYETIVFDEAAKFLAWMSENRRVPDLVVTDFKMPRMTGTEMLARAHGRGFHFPCILLTGHLTNQTSADAIELGVLKIFEKPISSQALHGHIEQLLIESEVRSTRHEIRDTMAQLKEVYEQVRNFGADFMPTTTDLFVEHKCDSFGNQVEDQFEELLAHLELRLEKLLKHQSFLSEVRVRQAS